MNFFGRKDEIKKITQWIHSPNAEFCHVRGRRRIGKTSILEKISEKFGAFYFTGFADESDLNCRNRIAEDWDQYTGIQDLSTRNSEYKSWKNIFSYLTSYSKQNTEKKVILIFDEIQWLAKKGSGVLGLLKREWEKNWQYLENVKVILAGSSSKFFLNQVDNPKGVLYGLRTASDLIVLPFTLTEIDEYYSQPKDWSREQTCLINMMTGGVPYYLNQIKRNAREDTNFFRTINKTFFMHSSIFLNELENVLFLDFRDIDAIGNVKNILRSLGQDGTTEVNIVFKTGIPKTTVNTIISKLIDYKIIFRHYPMGQPLKRNHSGAKYIMRDPFLQFYFQVLEPLSNRIIENEKAMLFNGEVISSDKGYYIPNFSGKAFELLVFNFLQDRRNKNSRIFKKLNISDIDYEVGTYWKEKITQLDLIIESKVDRESRIIEIKWINQSVDASTPYIDQLKSKKYLPPTDYTATRFLICSRGFTNSFFDSVAEDIQLMDIDDLFSPQPTFKHPVNCDERSQM